MIKGNVVTWSETINLLTFSGKYETGKVFSDTTISLVVSLTIALFTENMHIYFVVVVVVVVVPCCIWEFCPVC